MIASIVGVLLFATAPTTADAEAAQLASVSAAKPELAEEQEICRSVTVVSYNSPGGIKTSRLCKTRDEWKDYVKRGR